MGRKPGLNSQKMGRIMSILAANPDGIWIREIARQCKYSHATVARYVNTALKPFLEDVSLGPSERPLLRVVRLKPYVIERLQEGKSMDQIMKMMKLIERIGQS